VLISTSPHLLGSGWSPPDLAAVLAQALEVTASRVEPACPDGLAHVFLPSMVVYILVNPPRESLFALPFFTCYVLSGRPSRTSSLASTTAEPGTSRCIMVRCISRRLGTCRTSKAQRARKKKSGPTTTACAWDIY